MARWQRSELASWVEAGCPNLEKWEALKHRAENAAVAEGETAKRSRKPLAFTRFHGKGVR